MHEGEAGLLMYLHTRRNPSVNNQLAVTTPALINVACTDTCGHRLTRVLIRYAWSAR